MKKYNIQWETCYCEDYPEKKGFEVVEAQNVNEAIKKLEEMVSHAIVIRINEIR